MLDNLNLLPKVNGVKLESAEEEQNNEHLFETLFNQKAKEITYTEPVIYTKEDIPIIEEIFKDYPNQIEHCINEINEFDFCVSYGAIENKKCHAVQSDNGNLEIDQIFWGERMEDMENPNRNYQEKAVELSTRRFLISVFLYKLVYFVQDKSLKTKEIQNVSFTTNREMLYFLINYLELNNADFEQLLRQNGEVKLDNYGQECFDSSFNINKLKTPNILRNIKKKSQKEFFRLIKNVKNYLKKEGKNTDLSAVHNFIYSYIEDVENR